MLRTDDKRRCAITEKLTFEICASLIAYEVKAILGTINRPAGGKGKLSNADLSNKKFQI